MESKEIVEEYCRIVNEQVRWKVAHVNISEELKNHIDDQKNALIQQGMDKDEAIEAAVKEMGDPYSVGLSLDRVHKPKVQGTMLFLAIILTFIGAFTRYLIVEDLGSTSFMVNDAILLITGIALMLLFYYLDFSIIGKYPFIIFSAVILASIVVLTMSLNFFGRAYLSLAGFNMSLGYLFSLIFPVAIAALVYKMRNYGYKGILLIWCGITVLNFILLIVPMLIGAIHFSIISVALLCVAIYKEWFGVKRVKGFVLSLFPVIMASAIVITVMIMNEKIKARLLSGLFTWDNQEYIVSIRVLFNQLISHAKFIGRGNGVDTSLLNRISVGDVWTDNIVSYSVYTYGWLPFVIVMAVMLYFIIKAIKLCLQQKSIFGLLVSLSIILSIIMQVTNYMLYNFGIGMSETLSLPFISYGNTALIINLAMTGLMLSVFRNGDEVNDSRLLSVRRIMTKG